MTKTIKNVVMNETRKAVIKTLKASTEPLTLAEISTKIGKKVASGSTNAMVAVGMIKVVGQKEVITYRPKPVNTYKLGATALKDCKGVKESELRCAIVKCLGDSAEPLTMEEISAKIGKKVAPGTVNPMTEANILAIAGKKNVMRPTKANKDIYVLGEVPTAEEK